MSQSKAKARLYVGDDLITGAFISLDAKQTHYLSRVMRLEAGDGIALFNGRDGEWLGVLQNVGKKTCSVALSQQTRRQSAEPDLWLAFAPLKKTRTDFLVEKATELGVARLITVFTDHTDTGRVNTDRLALIAREAAEQCQRQSVPDVSGPQKLAEFIAQWPENRCLLVADETGGGEPLSLVLGRQEGNRTALLIGPEGGFSRSELDLLGKLPFSVFFGLGPRILRAETAALAALACVQSLVGDWNSGPRSS